MRIETSAGFLGFLLDEADHMQINAHWPVIDYYGYEDQHYLVETDGLNLVSARQVVLDALSSYNASLNCQMENLLPPNISFRS